MKNPLFLTSLFCVVSLSAVAHAQSNAIKSRTYAPYLGNSSINVRIAGWAAARNFTTPKVETAIYTPWKLFNRTGELHRVSATAVKNVNSLSGNYRMVIGGTTKAVGWPNMTSSVQLTRWARAFATNASQTFYIYSVPITIQGNAAANLKMDLTFQEYKNSQGAALVGTTESYAYGWAGAGVGVSGLQVGLEFAIRLGHQKFDNYIGAFPNYLSTAFLNYDFEPVRLYLKAFIELGFRLSKTIVDVGIGGKSFHPFIQ